MEKRRTGRLVGWLGVILSLGYLVGLWWLVRGRVTTLNTMPLNEVGDFLAGAFGPLAILWLVLGFFQQGFELRQNSAALELQAAELKNSVEQQAELARVAREQLASDREALEEERRRHEREQQIQKARSQPAFQFSAGGSHSLRTSTHTVEIGNTGATCTDVRVTALDIEPKFEPPRTMAIEKGLHVRFKLAIAMPSPFSAFDVEIAFRDGFGDEQSQLFRCTARYLAGNDFPTLVFARAHERSAPSFVS